MKVGLLGGLRVEHDGQPIVVSGAMQLAVFFRLAVDAGRAVSVREIVEDVWSRDAPENERAALQSVISRLRSQLPPGAIESTVGGYRLAVAREDVDALAFEDLAAASDPRALELWAGEPWIPSPNFDWFERDLLKDHARIAALHAPLRSTIPAPLTDLVGRHTELAMIAEQLRSNRLVTIVGTGGAGKTRLAVETALGSPGALLVELAPVGPDEVMTAVLTATGRELRLEAIADTTGTRERVIEALFGRSVLLVLDNCEHLVEEAARVASDLLGSLPNLRILATSREPLAIPGEAFVAVGSLPPAAALELFRQRATAASGTETDEDAAARVCARLDGLPLALELAAAKLRTMTIDEVIDGLEHRFTLLTGGYRTALPRHQTLRALIDWSWSLLGDDERFVLARLAVFPAGVDAGDAAHLAAQMGLADASVFDSLVDRSLLQRSRGRYRTLETIREYGLDRLAEEGATADARELQARSIATRAAAFDRGLRGPGIHDSIAWFDAEEDNIVAALRFTTTSPLPEVAVELGMACIWYWIIRDRNEDAQTWFRAILPLAAGVDRYEARLIAAFGPAVGAFADLEPEEVDPADGMRRAAEFLKPLAAMPTERGAHQLFQLVPAIAGAFVAVAGQGDWMTLVSVPSGEELGLDAWPTATLHVMRAALAQNRGDIEALGVESSTGVEQFERIGDLWGLAFAQQMRAEWFSVTGRLEEALAISTASTENMRRIASSWELVQQQNLAVSLLLRLGRVDEARERVTTMLRDAETVGNVRTQLQAAMTAVLLDVHLRDAPAVEERLAVVEELATGWSRMPPQLRAGIEVQRAEALLVRGDADGAEAALRTAAEVALASHDQPVIALVAYTVGTLALARGQLGRALEAVDVAAALVGAYDPTHPKIVEIERAAADAGIGRAGGETLTRPMAFAALKRLVGAPAEYT